LEKEKRSLLIVIEGLRILSSNNDFAAIKAYSLGEMWVNDWVVNYPRNFTLHPRCNCSYDDESNNPSLKNISGGSKDNFFEEKTNNTGKIQVNVYPNPVNNTIFISLDKIPATPVHYQLYDIQGKELQSGKFNSQKQELNISTLSKGIYFISVTIENQSKITTKVVKE
jgi:hypothetical protein